MTNLILLSAAAGALVAAAVFSALAAVFLCARQTLGQSCTQCKKTLPTPAVQEPPGDLSPLDESLKQFAALLGYDGSLPPAPSNAPEEAVENR